MQKKGDNKLLTITDQFLYFRFWGKFFERVLFSSIFKYLNEKIYYLKTTLDSNEEERVVYLEN